MSRFKTYAVVEKSTGEVLGAFLHDSICDKGFVKINDIKAEIRTENSVEVKDVFLSMTKGNIEKSRCPKNVFYNEGESLVTGGAL